MNLAATDPDAPRLPLGVGRILRETVTLLAGNIRAVFLLCFLPLLVLAFIEFLAESGAYLPLPERSALFGNGTINIAVLLNKFLTGAYAAIVSASLCKYVSDLKLGNPAGITGSAAAVLTVFVPLVISDFLAGLVAFLGMFALILPGLYLAALWFVLIPCIVLEKSGFQAFNRSAMLTRNYRWRLVAVVAAFLVAQIILSQGFVHYFGFLLTSGDTWQIAVHVVMTALLTTVFISLSATYFTLTYLRLRDIKEGTVWLADVFD